MFSMISVEELEWNIRKDRNKFKADIEGVSLFFKDVDVDTHLQLYDEIAEEKLKYEKIKLQLQKDLIDLTNKIGRLKGDLLSNEGIVLEDRIFEFGLNKGVVLDKLFQLGVVSVDKYEFVKDLMWKKRYKKSYSDQSVIYKEGKETMRDKGINKRRFNTKDFENRGNEDIVDMNDIKSVFREFVVMEMEKNFEKMIKQYFNKR